MKHVLKHSLLLGAAVAALTSCNKDDDTPGPVNEPEVITSLGIIIFEASAPGTPIDTVWFRDPDGEGGNPPTVEETMTLNSSTNYLGRVLILNETEVLLEDAVASDFLDEEFNKTLEVEEEDDEHQLFYVDSPGTLWTAFSYTDMDDNTDPIGLEFSFTTGSAGSGTLQVTLIHEPDKGASGVSSGDPTNAGGETDVDVTFNVTINP